MVQVPSQSAGAATRIRYVVLALLAVLSMITYLDRVSFSAAQSHVIQELGLRSEADLKYAFMAFILAYSLFELPSSWWGDVFGPRRVLIRIVVWWSFFTAAIGTIGLRVGHGMVGAFTIGSVTVPALWTLVAVQFLFGLGEAGAYPNITRALHNWFPFQERGRAQGVVWMSARLMGGLTPLVWAILVEGINWVQVGPFLHWRSAFWTFGGLGVVWCVIFAIWFRNRPEEKPSVSAAELELIRQSAADSQAGHARVPWGRLARSGNLWTLCIMYFCQSYGWWFYITYMPRYLEQQHGVLPTEFLGAVYKGGPLWMGAIGCLAGGFLTDWFIRRTGNRRLGRRLFGAFGHGMCALCFLACPFASSAFSFFLAISLAGFFADLTMASSWASCQDIGRRHAAIVAGCMNMIGNFGGAAASWVTGMILDGALETHAVALGYMSAAQLSPQEMKAALLSGYRIDFLLFAAIYVVGVVCWLRFDSTKPVLDE
ncbi:MAG: MFS transporter [Thermoguttaceae bacterium]